MLLLALIIFVIVAAGGLFMASRVIGGKPIPARLPQGHAAGGAVGLLLLLWAALGGANALVWAALIILGAGFAGGLFLFGFMYRGRPKPTLVIAAHGLLGLTGVAVLIAAWLQ